MEKGKITEITAGTQQPVFFFDQWKQLRETNKPARLWGIGSAKAPNSDAESNPNLAAKASDQLRETAHASLGKYKQTLVEYQKAQQAHRLWKEKAQAAASPREQAVAAQTLRRVEAQLDSLERELRNGRQRTKSALDGLRAAS